MRLPDGTWAPLISKQKTCLAGTYFRYFYLRNYNVFNCPIGMGWSAIEAKIQKDKKRGRQKIHWSRWSVDLRWMFENWCFIHLRWSCSYQLPNSFKRCLKFFQVHIQKYVSPRHNKKCYGSLQAVDKIKYGNYTDLLMAEIESGKAITTKKWNRIWI